MSHALLTRGQEAELAKRIEDGDLEARNLLVEHNVRLAIKLSTKYLGRGLEFEDLVQEALVGMHRAAEKFDWRRNIKFSTYATWWVKQRLSRACADHGKTIRVPVHVGSELAKLARIETRLATALGHEPTEAELAAALDCSIARLRELRSIPRPSSLDVQGDQAEPAPDLADVAGEREAAGILRLALDELPYRSRHVLILRAGMDGQEPRTLDEIAALFGSPERPLQRERVRQIELHALDALRSGPFADRLRGEISY